MSTNKNIPQRAAVLLISNDQPWCNVMQNALKQLCTLKTVSNDEKALELIHHKLEHRGKIQIIVVDVGMLGGRSLALVRRIQEIQSDAKIVVATAAPTWRQAKDWFQLGATDYIRKSLDEKELISNFQEILRKKAPLRQSDHGLVVTY